MSQLDIPPLPDLLKTAMDMLAAVAERLAVVEGENARLKAERDAEWTVAIASALWTCSGVPVPIVPETERFRELFAALRRDLFELYSEKQGHRWALTRGERKELLRCIDCGNVWPAYGDLAPMPACPGNRHDHVGEERQKREEAERKLAAVERALRGTL